MGFFDEYGLLVAIATPVAVIGLVNVLLALGGETGTLLLPTLKGFPSVLQAAPAPIAEPMPVVEMSQARRAATSGFDEADELLARQAA